MTFALRYIPLLPFLGAALLLVFGRRWRRGTVELVALGAIAGGFGVSAVGAYDLVTRAAEGGLTDHVFGWVASESLRIGLDLRMDALAGFLCLVVTLVGSLIHVYSMGYMEHDPHPARFFGYLNLFCGAMLVLVLGDSLPVMFIGWEGVGLCSYLLIGFWYGETANADAGKKAFITNRVGDFGFLLGMFVLYQATGSFAFPEITKAATADGPLMATAWLGMPLAFWAALLLFVGACGKSAQIPLHVWLPDAMAGPTPVSALIHAATMVTAGVYMVARLHAVYVLAPAAMAIVALVGAATAVFAALIGFAQNDFKKVLAYSTVSQLGFMFAGVGTGNFGAGIFHLGTHAFFKAGLFLCAGSVMHAMSGSGDITKMGGLRKRIPQTHLVFLICWLAICGAPFLSGFFSKDSIVAGAFASEAFGEHLAWVGKAVGLLLLGAALGTAFYMSRLYFLVFRGECRADRHTQEHIHESPPEMVVPLWILAAGAALCGYLGFPAGLLGKPEWNLLAHFLEPSLGAEMEISHRTEIVVMLISTVVAGAGVGIAWLYFGNGWREPAHRFAGAYPGLVGAARAKFYVDEIYRAVVLRPLRRFADLLFQVVDRVIIDRLLVDGLGQLVDRLGRVARSLQSGDGQRYLAVFSIGAAILVWAAARPADRLRIDGCSDSPFSSCVLLDTRVSVDASAGTTARPERFRYAFDFDGDGRDDRSGSDPRAGFSFEGDGTYTIRVRVEDLDWGTSRTIKRKVRVRIK